ncbi:MAG TPA: hypothetical protein VFU02_11690 [Polyangiaceae bacterium]|nr:hypothetical protein [Polyangiaceae bacterium]
MPNGSPPSSRRYLDEDRSLVEARGTLRDALGALGNLDQLLRSLRVGPKAISAVLPDVLDSCGPARDAVRELLSQTGVRLGSATAVTELEHFFTPRFEELQQSIELATRTPMHARHRLELERVVTRLSPELEAGRSLLDLLEGALAAPTIRLKLQELLDQITVAEFAKGTEPLKTTLRGKLEDIELLVQPQVAMMLLTLGANLVVAGHEDRTPELSVEARPDGGCTIRFQLGSVPGEALLLPRQTIVPPTLACVETAATKMGCSVERGSDSSTFSLTWA